MSFRGLQLVQDGRKPFITLSSLRNLAEIPGEVLKEAISSRRIRQHRIFICWGMRKYHTECIQLKDLPLLNTQLNEAINPELIVEILQDYRNII